MAITLVSETNWQSASTATSSPGIDTTGATCLVVMTAANAASSFAITDNKGNSYTKQLLQASGPLEVQIWMTTGAVTVGTGHTFTNTVTSGGFFTGIASAWSDVTTTSAYDQHNQATSSATTIAAGSITPSQNDEVVIFCVAEGDANFVSVDSGFTKVDFTPFVGGVAYGGFMGYLVQTSATAENPTYTGDVNSSKAAGLFSLISASSSPNVDLTATNAAGSAAALSVTADKNTSLTATNASGAASALSLHIDSNITLSIVSGAGSAATVLATPGVILVSAIASGSALPFTQNKSFTLGAVSANGSAAGLFVSARIVSESTVGAMSDKLAIDAIASNLPVASNGTMTSEPVAAIGSLLAA